MSPTLALGDCYMGEDRVISCLVHFRRHVQNREGYIREGGTRRFLSVKGNTEHDDGEVRNRKGDEYQS